MTALVVVWRVDVLSARHLYGLSAGLADAEVLRAVQQSRPRSGATFRLPPWLQALAGYAWIDAAADEAEWISDADETCVLRSLTEHFAASVGPVAVWAAAQDLARQLRLRCLLRGLSASFSQTWAARLCDGSHWQPQRLHDDADAAAAVLQLATQQPLFAPTGVEALDADAARAQARALQILQTQGWL